ncbi:MAG: RNA-binding S4 domain-containing protein [Oscillospiraceae bacterium]|nr:RNA-binding S4 domain-containing protein [Oscillospiraceae bacterium]
MNKIYINPPYIKLEQALKLACLVASGGEAKLLIQDGCVLVNGEVCLQRGKKLLGGEIITLGTEKFEVCLNDN